MSDTRKAPPDAAVLQYDATSLAQVWGDVVDLRHLRLAIPIGAAVALGAYLGSTMLFRLLVEDPAMARAYGMLVGIVGCVSGGAICAVLFKPKRIVRERMDDSAWLEQTLDQLAAERGGIGRVEDLPPAAVRELKDLGLYDLFAARAEHEARGRSAAPVERR
jgi:hypothetical protein